MKNKRLFFAFICFALSMHAPYDGFKECDYESLCRKPIRDLTGAELALLAARFEEQKRVENQATFAELKRQDDVISKKNAERLAEQRRNAGKKY